MDLTNGEYIYTSKQQALEDIRKIMAIVEQKTPNSTYKGFLMELSEDINGEINQI